MKEYNEVVSKLDKEKKLIKNIQDYIEIKAYILNVSSASTEIYNKKTWDKNKFRGESKKVISKMEALEIVPNDSLQSKKTDKNNDNHQDDRISIQKNIIQYNSKIADEKFKEFKESEEFKESKEFKIEDWKKLEAMVNNNIEKFEHEKIKLKSNPEVMVHFFVEEKSEVNFLQEKDFEKIGEICKSIMDSEESTQKTFFDFLRSKCKKDPSADINFSEANKTGISKALEINGINLNILKSNSKPSLSKLQANSKSSLSKLQANSKSSLSKLQANSKSSLSKLLNKFKTYMKKFPNKKRLKDAFSRYYNKSGTSENNHSK